MRKENQDVISQKCIRGDDNLSLDEFPRSQNLPHVDPVAGPAQFITPDDVLKSLKRTKKGKAAGPSGVFEETLKAAPDICCEIIADLMNAIILEGMIPADWSDSITVSLFLNNLFDNQYFILNSLIFL